MAQNWWKWPKRLCQYFPEDHKYDCNCFRRLLYTPWATSHPNIMAVNRILQNPPWFLVNSCLFWHFWGDFDISDIQYQNLVNTCWPKNSENVFHAPKSPHPKYYVIIITGSKKIQFWRSHGSRSPFEIITFNFQLFNLFWGVV